MSNPINPLEWIKSAQDWFAKTEKGSGFRVYLIFMILAFGIAICMLIFLKDVKYAREAGLFIILISVINFIGMFNIKSFTDPNFCRSESHVEKIRKIELEMMGSDKRQVSAEILERELLSKSSKEPHMLPSPTNDNKKVSK